MYATSVDKITRASSAVTDTDAYLRHHHLHALADRLQGEPPSMALLKDIPAALQDRRAFLHDNPPLPTPPKQKHNPLDAQENDTADPERDRLRNKKNNIAPHNIDPATGRIIHGPMTEKILKERRHDPRYRGSSSSEIV